MKRFNKLIALCVLIMTLLSTTANAARIGDVINYARHTDIVARINGFDIDSYNVDGYTYIVVEDLSKFGFNVTWNAGKRTLSVAKNNYASTVTSNYVKPTISASKVGTKSYNILYTDIVTYVNGKSVQSYNINGKTLIQFDSLGAFGPILWDPFKREISLAVANLNKNASKMLTYSNFIGEWDGISSMYLAQHLDIGIKIISVDDVNQNIKLSYRYKMGSSGIWSGGEAGYSSPITVKYHAENIKVEVNGKKIDRVGYVTDMINVMGSNKNVSSIIGSDSKKLCHFKLAISDSSSLYNMGSSSGWTYLPSYKCKKIR